MSIELNKSDCERLSATGPFSEGCKQDRNNISRYMLFLVGGVFFLGIVLRLVGLSDHTMGHNEIYIPGIKLPQHLANPGPRLTFRDTITGTIAVESHPPGYYIFMLGWTKCFGTNLFSIRLPSVLFDGGTIVLIYILAAYIGMSKSGLLAALFWATGGLATYLAQEARMYPMTCFLGVLSTLLLVKTYGGTRSRRRLMMAAYILTLLAGLSTSHFFWPILLVHMLYVLLGPTPLGGHVSGQLRWQWFVVALASPLLAVAMFQSGRESYLSQNIWQQLLGYLCLLFVWTPTDGLPTSQWLPTYALIVIVLFCVVMLTVGIRKINRMPIKHCEESVKCPIAILIFSAGLAMMSIAVFAYATFRKRAEFDWLTYRLWPIVACGVIPLIVLLADYLSRRYFSTVRKVALRFGAPLSPVWLVTMLAIIPVAILVLISFVIPLIALRTVVIFGPFLLLVISAGVLYCFNSKLWRILVITILLALNIGGHVDYRKQPHSPDDYAGITGKIISQIKPDDLLFVFRHWAMTPIYYYLDSESYNFIGHDHTEIIEEHPEARVWVFGFDELPPPTRVTDPLSNYRRLNRVEARGIYTDLYIPVLVDSAEKAAAIDSDI